MRILTFLLFLPVFALYAQPNTLQVMHRLERVKVFLHKAQLTHTAETELKPGKFRLIFTGLSNFVEASSVQVTGKGQGVIGGVRIIPDFLASVGNQSPNLTKLKDSIDFRKEQVAEWSDQVEIYQKEEAMLMSNQKLGSEEEGFDVELLSEATSFFRTKLVEIRKLKREALKVLQYNSGLLKQYEAQWGLELEQSKQAKLDLVVDFIAQKEGKYAFEFSYILGEAGWEPSYDIRMNDQQQSLSITMKATIRQYTGIDWSRVMVTLSDRVPSSHTQVPVLPTWRLDMQSPVQLMQRGNSLRSSREKAAFGAVPMATMDAEEADMGYSSALVTKTSNTLTMEYHLVDMHTIKGTGQEETVSVTQLTLPVTKRYLSVPKIHEQALLLANISGWDTLNLLAGKASVYLDGTYTSETLINPNVLTDTFSLVIGSDPGVVVNRSIVTSQTMVRTVGGQKRITRTYALGIRNKKQSPVELILKDQVPISANSQISVEVSELSGGILNKETGEIEWRIMLPAMTQMEKKIGFEVKFPKNQVIEGL